VGQLCGWANRAPPAPLMSAAHLPN
jgi:hypothetical protein